MKKIGFTIIIMMLLAFHGNAQKKKNVSKVFKGNTEAASITVKKEEEIVKYKFDTIKDFEENSNKILDEIKTESEEVKKDKCEITVEISVTINEEFISTTVSGSITAFCESIAEAVKALRAELIASVKE